MFRKYFHFLRHVNIYFFFSFVLINLYLIPFVFIPYFFKDGLQSWNAAGHLFAAWFNRTYLFPSFTGWNPFFFAGYPQDTFFPPLYHYLISVLSFIFGLSVSMKLINISAVLLLPVSFYFFAKRFHFSSKEASFIMFLMMIPVVSLNVYTGGSLYSLFVGGLGPNALALPFLFFFMGKLQEERSRHNLLYLVFYLSVMLLTNFVVALVAFITMMVQAVMNLNKSRLIYLLRLLLSSLTICGMWIVPLLAYARHSGEALVSFNLQSFITFPLFLLIVAGAGLIAYERDEKIISSPLLVLIILFASLAFVEFKTVGIPFHPSQFVIYFMALVMIMPYKLIFNKLQGLFKASFILIFVLLLGIYFYQGIQSGELYRYKADNVSYSSVNIGKLDGRVLTFNGENIPHMHDARVSLAENSKLQQVKGMFSRSSVNSKYLGSLHMNAVGSGSLCESGTMHVQKEKPIKLSSMAIKKGMDLFNINYLLLNQAYSPSKLVKKVSLEKGEKDYLLYRVGNSSLVELLNYQPRVVDKKYLAKAMDVWFKSSYDKIFVVGNEVPSGIASNYDSVTILEQNEQQTYLKLNVNSKKNVPVFVKMSYFPRWKAYVNGKRAEVYQASPYLMLVYGKGIVELKYERSMIDYFGCLVSLFGAVYLYMHFKKIKIRLPKKTNK